MGRYTKLFLDNEARRDFSLSLGIMGINIDDNDDEEEDNDDKSDSVVEIKSYIINNKNEIKDSE